jgi:hypothetical protein
MAEGVLIGFIGWLTAMRKIDPRTGQANHHYPLQGFDHLQVHPRQAAAAVAAAAAEAEGGEDGGEEEGSADNRSARPVMIVLPLRTRTATEAKLARVTDHPSSSQ